MNKPLLWIYLHLRKSGGTTFNGHVARHLQFGTSFVQLSRWGRLDPRTQNREPFEEWQLDDRKRVRVISGHQAYFGLDHFVPGSDPRYLTVLRDPADRILSRYNSNRSRGQTNLSIDDWYTSVYRGQYCNSAVRFYASRLFRIGLPDSTTERLRLAKALLDRCWFVGLTEHLNDDLPYLFSAIGIPARWQDHRVADGSDALAGLPDHPAYGERITKHAQLTASLRQHFHEDNQADLDLYHYARSLRRKLLAQLHAAGSPLDT